MLLIKVNALVDINVLLVLYAVKNKMKMNKNLLKNLINRYLKGIYTVSDIDLLREELNKVDSSLRSEMEKSMAEEWSKAQKLITSEDELRQYDAEAIALLNDLNREPKTLKQYLLPYLKYAAMIAIVTVTALGGYAIYEQQQIRNIEYITVNAQKGKRETVVLSDGTKVTLNAHSSLRYPSRFVGKERQVELEGEAFFDVSRDEEMPFKVLLKDFVTEVLGTSFNISSYMSDNSVSVHVERGKVRVLNNEVSTLLVADEIFEYNRIDGLFTKRSEKSVHSMAWMHGTLSFKASPIKSVINQIMRYYDCDIVLDPKSNFNELIYGEHENKSLEAILRSIEYSTDIKIRKAEGGRIIFYKE